MLSSEQLTLLRLELQRDEGFRSKPYKDSVGILTIGYGRNLEDVGIDKDEAAMLLANDIAKASSVAYNLWPWLKKKPPAIQRGLINMVFNMGPSRVLGFQKMLWALEKDDYVEAAKQALDSKWAKQVGKRAERIADLFRNAES